MATKEILATQTPQRITRNNNSQGFEILNLGPNSIWVAIGLDGNTRCVVGKCREVKTGAYWSADATGHVDVWVRAATADQLTGAATVFTEAEQVPA